MWNNFHNLRHAVSKCIKQCKQRTKTLGNIWGIMGLYGRVWESQAKQKTKTSIQVWKGMKRDWKRCYPRCFSLTCRHQLNLFAGHVISWYIMMDLLVHFDIFWYIPKTLPQNWHLIYIGNRCTLSRNRSTQVIMALRVFKRYRINSIHIKPNAAWCPIFDPFFALLCTDMPRYAKINLYVHRTWLYARVLWLRASTLGVSCQPTQLCWPRGG